MYTHKISKYIIIIIAVIGLSSILPKIYSTVFITGVSSRYISFSPIIHDFVYSQTDRVGKRIYGDFAGNDYTQQEYTRLQPFMYYGVLENWGEAPDIVNGQLITSRDVFRARDVYSFRPAHLDREYVRIKLYPLFDDGNDMNEIRAPQELFRINNKMEFLTADTNTIDKEKTELFTDAMLEQGFQFPAKIVAGNENVRKPFDFGYFIQDNKDEVYHVYQKTSVPYVKKTNIIMDNIYSISVKESHHDYYGMLITIDGEIHIITNDDYKLNKLTTASYNVFRDRVFYMKDLQNILTEIDTADNSTYHVSTNDFQPIKSVVDTKEKRYSPMVRSVYSAMFPFVIDNNRYTHAKMIEVKLSNNILIAFIFSLILALGYFVANRKHANKVMIDIALILIGGLYALIPILLLRYTKDRR